MDALARRPLRAWLGLTAALLGAAGTAQRGPGPGPRGDGGPYLSEAPAHVGSIVLGRPTDTSVVASIVLRTAAKVHIEFEYGAGWAGRTEAVDLAAGSPRELLLAGLKPDRAYQYRVIDEATGRKLLPETGEGAFHTQRRPGSRFTFTIQADAHLDAQCTADLYGRTLGHVAAAKPDFHIDLGDTFMAGKIIDRDRALKQYLAQRYYVGKVADRSPFFLCIGNHDGEEPFRRGGGEAGNLSLWSLEQRKRLFPNPMPGPFYSGNKAPHPDGGALQDYYAWTWGDALFVVLDPYWYSSANRGGQAPWASTLGKEQYEWLGRTLRASRARWKLVFIHQLVGGLDAGGRGGAEAARLYEWGGREKDGANTFPQHRPTWEMPIHDLLVKTGVSVVFHGHDHFFARQELDGVVYQLAPQPANRSFRRHSADEYGYVGGDFVPNCGHLRVAVEPASVEVAYVRTADSEMQRNGIEDGSVAFRYTRKPR